MATLAAPDHESKPETRIASRWQDLCDAEPPASRRSAVDSAGAPLPEGSFLVHGLFSEGECAALIEAAETTAGFGITNYAKKYRGNLRLMTSDRSLAAVAWDRLKALVPPTITLDDGSEWYAVGLNEVWRLAKY